MKIKGISLILLSLLFPFVLKAQTDKQLHCMAGFIAGSITYTVFGKTDDGVSLSLASGFIVGGMKEGYDYYSEKGTASPLDFNVTGLGGIFGTITFKVLLNRKKWQQD